jgi:hypothetical protein
MLILEGRFPATNPIQEGASPDPGLKSAMARRKPTIYLLDLIIENLFLGNGV